MESEEFGKLRHFSAISKRAKWNERHFTSHNSITLKWFICEYSNDMDRVETRRVVKKAFELWSSQSHIKNEKKIILNFAEALTKEDADINILWAEGDHGDEYPVSFWMISNRF